VPDASSFSSLRCLTDTTIQASATTSAAVELAGTVLAGLIMPASFNGATVTFRAESGGVWRTVHKADGTALAVAVAADRHITIDPDTVRGLERLQIVSNATEGALRTISVLSMPV